jgi:hypothetical protein
VDDIVKNPEKSLGDAFPKHRSSFEVAQIRVKESLSFASSFTTTIRTLLVNSEENKKQVLGQKKLNDHSRFLVSRLFNAPSVLSPFYFLIKTLNEGYLKDKEYISRREIIEQFKIEELAAVLALVYTYHRIRRIVDPEEWTRYSKVINNAVDIGISIGNSFPEIGIAYGALLTGVRYLGLACLIKHDSKAFKNYRRDVKIKRKMFDTKMELDIFGCTNVELGAVLLQSLGFGAEFASKFFNSLTIAPSKAVSSEENRMRVCLLWQEALHAGGRPPVIQGEDEFMASDEALDKLMSHSIEIIEEGSKYSWLGKGRSAINKRLVPQLYKPGEKEVSLVSKRSKTKIVEIDESLKGYQELPKQFQENFSEEHYDDIANEVIGLIESK